MGIKIQKGLYIIALFIQSISVIAVLVLQYLTGKKAGVMHHIYYRKYQYEQTFFSPENIRNYSIVVIVIAIIAAYICIKAFKKNKSNWTKSQHMALLINILILLYIMNSSFFKALVSYHYFIMAFGLVTLIQIIIVLKLLVAKR